MENNFEKWLKNIIQVDPHYMITIICTYYDDCLCCPLNDMCNYSGADVDALKWLLSASEKYKEDTK